MKAMILAAGRGERMRPLTDALPKPLLPVGDKTLIEHHIVRLQAAGCSEVVINTGWLGELLPEKLGDGSRYNLKIQYSPEPLGALETGGALRHALPLLGEAPFLLVNGDVWTDFPFARLCERELSAKQLFHIVLVPNPKQHPRGDFALQGQRLVADGEPRYTYSGIGVYRPELIVNQPEGRFPLAPLLRTAIDEGRAGGELYSGDWRDIGTPERLALLQQEQSNTNRPPQKFKELSEQIR